MNVYCRVLSNSSMCNFFFQCRFLSDVSRYNSGGFACQPPLASGLTAEGSPMPNCEAVVRCSCIVKTKIEQQQRMQTRIIIFMMVYNRCRVEDATLKSELAFL
jgi:hypothetical protein